MTEKQLRECARARDEAEDLHERIERIRSALTSMVRPPSDVPSSSKKSQDPLGDKVAILVDLERELQEKVIAHEALAHEVDSWLETLDDATSRIVRMRYFLHRQWKCIARDVHYSRASCYRKLEESGIWGKKK